eukprot:290858_1
MQTQSQYCKNEKNQLQMQLNMQIGKYVTLQSQYNAKTKLIRINNEKYNELNAQTKPIGSITKQCTITKLQTDCNNCQQQYDLSLDHGSKYDVLCKELNFSKMKCKQLDSNYQVNNEK